MKKLSKIIPLLLFFIPLLTLQADIIQLGLSLDASSGTDAEELPIFRQGVADGIKELTTDGTVELTITQFRSAAVVIWGPQIVDSPEVRQSAIDRVLLLDPQDSVEPPFESGTDIEEGLKVTADAMANSPNAASSVLQFINMLTDGNPTLHSQLDFSDLNEEVRKERAKQFAKVERDRIIGIGIDVISFEALGSGPDEIAWLETMAYPEPGVVLPDGSTDFPDPIQDKGFILNVATAEGIAAALQAKFEAAGLVDSLEPDPFYTPDDDIAKVSHDTPLMRIDVLTNDMIDPPTAKDRVNITSVSQPGIEGAMTGFDNANKYVYYQPAPGFVGMDTFTYTIKAGSSEEKTATVEVEVLEEAWNLSSGLSAQGWSFRNFASTTVQGRRYVALWDQYTPELFFILFRALISNGADALLQSDTSDSTPSKQARGTEQSETAVMDFLQAIQPGFSALLSGQGETQTISQDLVDDLKGLQALVQEQASPQLNAVVQEIADEHNGFDDFVGKNFDEWAESVGFDPNAVSIQRLNSGLFDGKFSITTYNPPDVVFKLERSTDLNAEGWVEVTNAEVVEEDNLVTLSDLDPPLGRAFYRLSNGLEQ